MPESAPAPNSLSGASGQAGLTWFQLRDLALRGRLPHLLQLGDGDACLSNVFFGLTTTVSASKATGSSIVLDAQLRLAVVHFSLQDRARGVGDVGLAAAELLEAAAGAGDADGDLDRVLLGLLEVLGHGLGDREHGGRAVDLDQLPWANAGVENAAASAPAASL